MHYVTLTRAGDSARIRVNLEHCQSYSGNAYGSTLEFATGPLAVKETPEELDALPPFVRRVSEGQVQSDPAVWVELLAAAEEAATWIETAVASGRFDLTSGYLSAWEQLRAAIAAARAAQGQTG